MTTPDTPAKKVVNVEILHLDETGYGYEGKHTRREWRAECLEYFEKGAEAFLAWQESWQELAAQNTTRAKFGVSFTFYDGIIKAIDDNRKKSHCIDFAGVYFEYHVNTQDFQFPNDLLFCAATFIGGVDFSRATFTGNVEFSKVTFTDNVYFSEAAFTGNVDFTETTFTGNVEFSKAIFTGNVVFDLTTFTGDANFRETTFTGSVFFDTIDFKGNVVFDLTAFTGKAAFYQTTFTGDADFSRATFKGDVIFSETTFNGEAVFVATTFRGKADFDCTTFRGDTVFDTTTFKGEVILSETTFTGNDVEILHLDETGYGYKGTHTRREWRAECLEYFEKGAEAFLAWQESWQELAAQNTTRAKFGVRFTFDDRSTKETHDSLQKSHCLDFAGHKFKGKVRANAQGFQFLNDALFNAATFRGTADFSKAKFMAKNAHFSKAKFTGNASFDETIFTGDASFEEVTFTGDAYFDEATFKRNTDFRAVSFKESANFLKAIFENRSLFQSVIFNSEVNFENAEFANVGHFEGAIFNARTSRIPSFRGVDMGSTRLDFALDLQDDSPFTINYFSKDEIKAAIINIEHLKRLSEEHGQIDQALNFNAMELQAKYLQVIEPLRAESLPWFKRTFKRYISGEWWVMRPTWLYGLLSNFGRSYMRPLGWYVLVYVIALSFALSCAAFYKPQNCSNNQMWNMAGLLSTSKPTTKKTNETPKEMGKEDGQLPLNGYQAAFEYANYHATGLVDFTGDSKLKDAINQRVFGEPIKPWWARLIGALLSIINTALLFLIALGLRNSYRLK